MNLPRTFTIPLFLTSCLIALAGVNSAPAQPTSPSTEPTTRFSHQLADYAAAPKLPTGRVDTDKLLALLQQLGVNTYYWLIGDAPNDWDDLKIFLPKAAAAKLDVWVYLLPPSESPPNNSQYSEPYRLDYLKWAQEIARLSLQHTNLTAWVIDDFYANNSLFSPDYVKQMQSKAHEINPHLAFLPLMYFPEITPRFVANYRSTIDGVVVAYPRDRHEIDTAAAILSGSPLVAAQFSCPPATPSAPGDYASATISAKILPGDHQTIRFQQRVDSVQTTAGYHFQQLLIDDTVVWESDVIKGKIQWADVQVDVTPQVHGKTTANITFRLLDKKGVSNYEVRWELSNLQTEGIQTQADFQNPPKWQSQHHGVLESGFNQPPPNLTTQPRLPYIVMTAASTEEFRLRHADPASPERIAQWLDMCLQAQRQGQCDGVVTYCLDKSPDSKTFPPLAKLFHQ